VFRLSAGRERKCEQGRNCREGQRAVTEIDDLETIALAFLVVLAFAYQREVAGSPRRDVRRERGEAREVVRAQVAQERQRREVWQARGGELGAVRDGDFGKVRERRECRGERGEVR